MNVSIRSVFLFLLVLCPFVARAQTVESVLRGLQERNLVLEWRASYADRDKKEVNPIVWPGNLKPFPQDGAITTLPLALEALNHASCVFDKIKSEFLAYDSRKRRFVNLRHAADLALGYELKGGTANEPWLAGFSPGSDTYFVLATIDLPSVGQINEQNWRAKLQLLASNINQLEALCWPVLHQAASTHLGDHIGQTEPVPGLHIPEGTDLKWKAKFPGLIPPDGSTYVPENAGIYTHTKLGPNPDDIFNVMSGDAEYANLVSSVTHSVVEWNAGAMGTSTDTGSYSIPGYSLRCVIGIRALKGPVREMPALPSAPSLDGDFVVFKGPSIAAYGDLTSGVCSAIAGQSGGSDADPMEGKLVPGLLTPLADILSDKLGSYNAEEPSLLETPSRFADKETVVHQAFQWLGIPDISISGQISAQPDEVSAFLYPSGTTKLHGMTFDKGNSSRHDMNGWGVFDVVATTIYLPKFTPLIVAPERLVPFTPPGEVEPSLTYGETVRVHIGRGINDPNQTAWLGTRPDGFGSIIFHGSAREFELVYEEDSSRSGAKPIGGATFATALEFYDPTLSELYRSGWRTRFNYIAEWLSPRLKQVKGGDVLVTIDYENSYKKTLKFSWAKDATNDFGSELYTPGPAFKTITILNPTTPEQTGQTAATDKEEVLPLEKNHLRVVEGDERFHEFRWESTKPNPDDKGTYDQIFKYRLGNAPDGADQELNVTIGYVSGWPQPWEYEQTIDGSTTKWEVKWSFDNYVSPLNTDRPEPLTSSLTGTDKTVTYDWEYLPTGYYYLKKISRTGKNWELNGTFTEFSRSGTPSEIQEKVDGKTHVISSGWTGNTRTTSYKFDEKNYRDERAVYKGAPFDTVDISAGGMAVGTFRFAANGMLAEASYPGGYNEVYDYSRTDDGNLMYTVGAGWGPSRTSGTITNSLLSRFGAVMDRSVMTTEGIYLALDTGSDFTGWGAPKTITHMRGDTSTISYVESGVNWGRQTTVTGSSGVAAGPTGYDWRSRITGFSTGVESLAADYSDPLKPKLSAAGGSSYQSTFSDLGELLAVEGNDGEFASYHFGKNGGSFLKVDGRTVNLDVDQSGVLKTVPTGLGSHGAKFGFGVAGGMLYSETVPLKKDDTQTAVSVRTYYDAKGRVKVVERPNSKGVTVSDVWEYDDARRSVTFMPGSGLVADQVESTLSADGSILTVKTGGKTVQTRREAQGSALVFVTEENGGSSSLGWAEKSRESIDPMSGSVSFTPNGIPAANVTVSSTKPAPDSKTTISYGTGDTLTIKLKDGLPNTVTGTRSGVPVDLAASHVRDRLSALDGWIDGQPVGLTLGPGGRILSENGPLSDRHYGYTLAGNNGFKITVTESGETAYSLTADAAGDITEISSIDSLSLTLNTEDALDTANNPGGTTTLLQVPGKQSSLLMSFNYYGTLTGKSYNGGGLTEAYSYSDDGHTVTVTTSGQGGSSSYSVTETPTSRHTAYANEVVDEQFFTDGLRASVTAPNDDRVFTYDHYALRKEIHRAGPWSGWSVERIPDALGRLGTIRVTGGHSVARDFELAYDGYSRLQGVRTGGVLGVYSRENPATHVQTGQLRTLTRGSLLTTWKYNSNLQLSEVTNARPGRPTFGYSYPDRNLDARGRVQKRTATIGRSWKDLSYDGTSQLKGADVDGGRVLSYSYDARGNRETQGLAATHTINGLDQIYGRTLTERGFGILGHVTPGAAVQVQSAAQPQSALNLDLGSGEFYGYWTVSQGGAGGRVTALVQGSLAGLGVNGTSAVAEEELSFVLPPSDEAIESDYAGRTKADGFWTYEWSDSGQLRRMIRKPGMFAQAGVSGEELSFVYDADGRRTKKTRTLTYSTGRQTVEVSRVLWSGWLPVLEERSRNGQISARRWFLWGADLSGTLEGAGGIGGLVAIVEEKPDGRSRTLYPVQDGLGNVTAVLDAADGATVARFDYGPFGEPLGEYGDVEACPFRFQTKWYDRESEHYYYGYRYYSPRLGRWLSRDPLGEDGGVNLYAYCGNDPVNRHDPTGMAWYNDSEDFKFIVLGGIAEGLVQGQANLASFGSGLQSGKDRLSEFGVTLFTDPKKIGRGIKRTASTLYDYYGNVDASQYLDDFGTGLDLIGQNLDSQEKVFHASGELIFDLTTAAVGGELASGLSRSATATLTSIGKLPKRTLRPMIGGFSAKGSRWEGQIQILEAGVDLPMPMVPRAVPIRQMMADISALTGREVALIRLKNGVRVLRMGTEGAVDAKDVARMIAHTHPSGVMMYSPGDMAEFIQNPLFPKSSVLIDPLDAYGARIPVSEWYRLRYSGALRDYGINP